MAKFEGNFKCPHCSEETYHHGISLDSDGVATIYCDDQRGKGCQKEFRVKAIVVKWVTLDKFGYPIKD